MLNPSTADEIDNDPTVERCCRRARMLGYGSVIVLNIFALRSTLPSNLYTHPDPIGPENDAHINAVLQLAKKPGSLFVCAWGFHGKHMQRGKQVLRMVYDAGVVPHHLGLTSDGHPRHPLYVAYAVKPKEFKCMP
jgi:hypothetical protein